MGVTIQEFDTYFRNGMAAQDTSLSSSLIQMFRGQPALAIESVANSPELRNMLTMTEMNVHPFGNDADGGDLSPNEDPTRRAVFISASVG